MQKRSVFFLISFAIQLCLYADSFGQATTNTKNEAYQLKKLLLQYHVETLIIDDQFSERVFNHVLDELDPEGVHFTQLDLEVLSPFKYKIDDELNTGTWNFFPVVLERYRKALQQSERILQNLPAIDIKSIERISTDTTYAKDEQAKKDLWRLMIKVDLIDQALRLKQSSPEVSESVFLQKNEKTLLDIIKAQKLRGIRKILNHPDGFEQYVSSVFLKSITNASDPHSAYMSPVQMQNFMSALSTEGYYFGFGTDANEAGEVVVANLMPGGPAWKSGEIQVGDAINKIRWEGKQWVNIVEIDANEINDLLDESNEALLEMEIRSPLGVLKTVKLRKEKLDAEENAVKGFILQGKNKIGYISLPDFYSQWGEKEGSRCANDVAREVVKLNKEKIEGLILDLRFNGGGSLSEAVAMAGIFIDAGPVGILKQKNNVVTTMKDINRGTVYDGPLLILINGFSASASEFLSAALQDYHRAVIVGSTTYGKATGQEFFSLDPLSSQVNFSSLNKKKPYGYSTITTSRIYRINGRSIQRKGIVPDVALPDLFDFQSYKEESYDNALIADSVIKKTYFQPLPELPLIFLKSKSDARTKNNTKFKSFIKVKESLQQPEEIETLNWNASVKQNTKQENDLEALERIILEPTTDFSVNTYSLNQVRMQWDDYIQSINAAWVEKLSTDILLEEGFHIICDHIEFLNQKSK